MRPQLIAFSQFKLGGVQNFYYNILSHAPKDMFDIQWIFEDIDDGDPKLPKLYGVGEEIVFKVNGRPHQSSYDMAKRFQQVISDRPGAVITSFRHELVTLHLHRRPFKTVYFICHDEGYVSLAQEYEFLIDVFIAHNIQFYEVLCELMPARKKDIFFIPYGVRVSNELKRQPNLTMPLRIVIAARMQKLKGVYDIPEIDILLKENHVNAIWTIIGNGPEKASLEEMLLPRGNFKFYSPDTNEEVLELMTNQDIFILPSRLDGLPVSMLESMSVGCVPVISAFNEGIKKVVTPDVGFVLPVGDNVEFAKAIKSLNENRVHMTSMGIAAHKKVYEHYNITIQAQKYFELFARYTEFKRPLRKKHIRYGGLLDYSFWPHPLRKLIRSVRTSILKA